MFFRLLSWCKMNGIRPPGPLGPSPGPLGPPTTARPLGPPSSVRPPLVNGMPRPPLGPPAPMNGQTAFKPIGPPISGVIGPPRPLGPPTGPPTPSGVGGKALVNGFPGPTANQGVQELTTGRAFNHGEEIMNSIYSEVDNGNIFQDVGRYIQVDI